MQIFIFIFAFLFFLFLNQPQVVRSADVNGRNQPDEAADQLMSLSTPHILSQHSAVKEKVSGMTSSSSLGVNQLGARGVCGRRSLVW